MLRILHDFSLLPCQFPRFRVLRVTKDIYYQPHYYYCYGHFAFTVMLLGLVLCFSFLKNLMVKNHLHGFIASECSCTWQLFKIPMPKWPYRRSLLVRIPTFEESHISWPVPYTELNPHIPQTVLVLVITLQRDASNVQKEVRL